MREQTQQSPNSGRKHRYIHQSCCDFFQKMVLLGRLELPTSPLPMVCSTTELQQLTGAIGMPLAGREASERSYATVRQTLQAPKSSDVSRWGQAAALAVDKARRPARNRLMLGLMLGSIVGGRSGGPTGTAANALAPSARRNSELCLELTRKGLHRPIAHIARDFRQARFALIQKPARQIHPPHRQIFNGGLT